MERSTSQTCGLQRNGVPVGYIWRNKSWHTRDRVRFSFVDLFDNVGTLVAVGKKAALFDEANRIRRLNRILVSDATATILIDGGTSTVVSLYRKCRGSGCWRLIGRDGGSCRPAFPRGAIRRACSRRDPGGRHCARADSGRSMMASHMAEIDWADTVVSIPAFLTIITIPLTFSIATALRSGSRHLRHWRSCEASSVV